VPFGEDNQGDDNRQSSNNQAQSTQLFIRHDERDDTNYRRDK